MARLRAQLPRQFPRLTFFFQPADIVDQVLNFGQPAPIDVRVSGPDSTQTYALAQRLTRRLSQVPGVVDAHVFQVPDAPALTVDVDRELATQVGMTPARDGEQRAGRHQLQRPGGAELLGRPAQRRELPARGAAADLPHPERAGPQDAAGRRWPGRRRSRSC